MGRPSGLLRPRRTQRMAFGEVLSHDLVDLRLAVRLETHIDALQKSVALHDDIETSGLLRVAEDLFEIADRGLKCRAPIDCHQSIARLEVGAIRRAVRNYRLDGQSRIQLHELHTQVTAAGKHLTDVLLAVMHVYGPDFDHVLRVHGTDRGEVLERLGMDMAGSPAD